MRLVGSGPGGGFQGSKGLKMDDCEIESVELTWSDVERYVSRCVWRRVHVGVVARHDVDEIVNDLVSLVWERNQDVSRSTLASCVTRAFSALAVRHGVRGQAGKIVRLFPMSVEPDKLTRADNTVLDQLSAVSAEESAERVQDLIRSVSPRSAALLLALQGGTELAPACESLGLARTSSTEQLREEVRAFYAAD